jgi:O-antigen ligase/tetratricopeptide (TPR) repeat protein
VTVHRLPTWFLNCFMLLFAVSAVLGTLPAYDRRLTSTALTAILASAALYFAIAYLTRSWLAVRIVSGVVILASTLLALYFITQFGYQDYPETPALIERFGQATTLPFRFGGYLHPNAAAAFLGVAVPLGITRALSSRYTWRKAFWAFCSLIIVYAIFLTYSRGSWLALGGATALVIALGILRRLPRRIALAVVGIVVVALAAGLVAIVALGTDNLPFLASTFSTASSRGQLYRNSLYLLGDYPYTGIGLGDTFAMVYSRYSLLIFVPFLTYAHNLPLAVWLNQGLLGLLAFGGVILAFYTLVYRVIRAAEPRRLFHGAWLGATVALLHGLTDAPQYADHRWVMPMLFIAMGLSVAGARIAVTELDEYEAPQPIFWRRWIALVAAVVVILVGVLAIFNRPLAAAWYTNLGAIDEARAELAPGPGSIPDSIGQETSATVVLTEAERRTYFVSAEAWYRRALESDPAYPNANRRLGNLLVSLGRYDEGVPLLETALAAGPTYGATIKGLGLAYVWVGRLEDAVRTIALHDDPDSIADELNTWGTFHNEQNRPLLAARAWETAQLMYPDSVSIAMWLLIADTYRTANDADSARRWYERVLEVEPDNQSARDGLAQMG